jgi:hypothetical protein
VPIARKIWIIFAINSSEKFFLSPKMLNWPKIFWRRGGGVANNNLVKNKNLSSNSVKKKNISSIGVQKKNWLPLRKSPPPPSLF